MPHVRRILASVAWIAGIALAAVILILVSVGSPVRAYEAGRLLLDLAALRTDTTARTIPPMMRAPVTYEVQGRAYRGDVYRPLDEPLAAIVLLHGAAPFGKDDPRLVEFAATLAGARFVVLVPDLVDLRKLRLRAAAATDVADAVLYMTSARGLAPNGRVGITALSVAAGPAILAASQPEMRERVHFVLAIGGYYDMLTTLTFLTTGHFRHDAQWHYREPNPYGKWLLVLSNIDKLASSSDRRLLAEIVKRKLKNPEEQVAHLVSRLGSEGGAVYSFTDNRDREQVEALFTQLPENLRSEIQALSLSNRDLSQIPARVVLVHGLDDPVIPYTESIALARALPPDRSKLFLVNGLVHVDLRPTLIDYWRLWRAVYALLWERDR